jgi:hypothetical protein
MKYLALQPSVLRGEGRVVTYGSRESGLPKLIKNEVDHTAHCGPRHGSACLGYGYCVSGADWKTTSSKPSVEYYDSAMTKSRVLDRQTTEVRGAIPLTANRAHLGSAGDSCGVVGRDGGLDMWMCGV